MKIERIFIFIISALCIGCSATRPSQASPPHETSFKDDIYIQEFLSLENYLEDTKQTKALKQLNHILAHDRAMHDDIDLALTVEILQGLRDGKTNEMLRFFEHHLDGDISVFGSEYRALPVAYQKQISLKPLRGARDYLAKYPLNNPDPVWEEDVTNAFKILDGK